MMGGSLRCESTLGVGTRIEISIPLKKVVVNENPPKEEFLWVFKNSEQFEIHKYSADTTCESVPDSSMRDVPDHVVEAQPHVLVVDDNRVNRLVASKMLKSLDVTCDTCDNGIQAVDSSQVKKYSMILMDMVMPGMSGEYATSIIKKNERNMNYTTPVIFLTANTSEEARRVCLEARGVVY